MTECILIGASGNVGKSLVALNQNNNILGTSRNKNKSLIQLDPFNKRELKDLIIKSKTKSVFLLSAISNVEECRLNTDYSSQINIELPKIVSEITNACNIKMIFSSTEYIYDGDFEFPKKENEKYVLPKNVYALQKYCSEKIIQTTNSNSLILRLPKMYNLQNPGNFVFDFISKYKKIKDKAKVAYDQIFSPLSCLDLQKILLKSIKLDLKGVYNCGGPESNSRYDYIKDIRNHFSLDVELYPENFYKLSNDKTLPLNVSMDSSKLYEQISYVPFTLKEYLEKFCK